MQDCKIEKVYYYGISSNDIDFIRRWMTKVYGFRPSIAQAVSFAVMRVQAIRRSDAERMSLRYSGMLTERPAQVLPEVKLRLREIRNQLPAIKTNEATVCSIVLKAVASSLPNPTLMKENDFKIIDTGRTDARLLMRILHKNITSTI